MRRIAAPMIGGMISSTLLTLLVIPAIYSLWKERSVMAGADHAAASGDRPPTADRRSAGAPPSTETT